MIKKRKCTDFFLDENKYKNAHYHFSFREFFDRKKINFGNLRVFNDYRDLDYFFQTEKLENLDIFLLPLEGTLLFKENDKETEVTPEKLIYISAGKGVTYQLRKKEEETPLSFLELWFLVEKRNTPFTYFTKNLETKQNNLNLLKEVTTQSSDISLFALKAYETKSLDIEKKWIYLCLLEGSLEVNGDLLSPREAILLKDEKILYLSPLLESKILICTLKDDIDETLKRIYE